MKFFALIYFSFIKSLEINEKRKDGMIKLEYLVVFIVGTAAVVAFAFVALLIDKKLHGGKKPKDENDSDKK